MTADTRRHIQRFLVVGGLSVTVDLLAYAGLSTLGVATPLAKGTSYIAGMALGFALNKMWTFGSRRAARNEVLPYVALYLVTLSVNIGTNHLALSWIATTVESHTAASLAWLTATGVTTILNFLGMRFGIFRRGIGDNTMEQA